MSNAKPPRPDDDVQKLAAMWAGRWTPLDGIEPWLRRHMDEMTRMVRVERWSWSDLARSLNEAGVTYAGGQWTASLLGDKVATLRWKRRWRERAAAPLHALPVELLREALGSLGTINQLVVNIQAAAPGAAAAAPGVHERPALPPAPLQPFAPSPGPPLPAPVVPWVEPARRTYSFARPRGLDPAPQPVPPPPPSLEAGTPAPGAEPVIDVQEVLARFMGKPGRQVP